MTCRISLFSRKLLLTPPPRGGRRSAESVYAQLRAAILDGRFVTGARLPVERQSAAFFGVSRDTVARAYARLALEGVGTVATRVRYIRVAATETPAARTLPARRTSDPRLNSLWSRLELSQALSFWSDTQRTTAPRTAGFLDFRPALVDPRLFPFEIFRRISAKQLRRMELKPPAFKSPQGNQGHFPLRSAVAAVVVARLSRGRVRAR